MSTTDRYDNVFTGGSVATAEAYDRAIDSLVRFGIDVVDAWEATVADDPTFVMGQVGRAYLNCTSSEAGGAAAATDILDQLGTPPVTERERTHLAAAAAYATGDLHRCRDVLARLTAEHPRDVLALVVGHQLDFFCGDAWSLRDRIGRALPAWDRNEPMYGFLLGMQSFGLEESGHYDHAAEAGLQALDTNPDDVWALHAVVHTYEMRGRHTDGLAFMDARRDDWTAENFFVVHNAWHEALFRLEADDVAGALAIYDGVVHTAESGPVALELVDAASLLWRLHLAGIDVGERWEPLADVWTEAITEPWYVFNDVHAVMAMVGAGRLDGARSMIAALRAHVADGPRPEIANVAMTAEVGLPVAEALVAFGEERYGRVVDLLHPIRTIANRFGGSHAQRDVITRTLLEAAIRDGQRNLAASICSERISLNGGTPSILRQLDRAQHDGETSDPAAVVAAR